MQQTRQIMGMPVTIIVPRLTDQTVLERTFAWFVRVDERFSPYQPTSEVSRINAGLPEAEWSEEITDIIRRCHATTLATNGYFNAWHNGTFDPSGIVKGWAIHEAAKLLKQHGLNDYYVEAGGDIEVNGANDQSKAWQIGIRNPFDRHQTVKVVALRHEGIATSGAYIRGEHIYNPRDDDDTLSDVASLTVIGPNVYEADRFATAAYAMGRAGIGFLDRYDGLEGYMIDQAGTATFTRGFERYLEHEL